MRIVVVGGAGFVGSAVSRKLVQDQGASVLVLDALTASASLASLAPIASSPRCAFRKADIREPGRVAALLQAFAPDAVIHTAAAAPGPASSTGDADFAGSWRLMEAVRSYWANLPDPRRDAFRFVGVSCTDHTLGHATASPRAACDDVLMSWHKAYGLPSVLVRAPQAFGPCQFPSAFVPESLIAGLEGEAVARPAGGVRNWVHVEDLASALIASAEAGTPGTIYAAAGNDRATPAEVAACIGRLVGRYAAIPAAAGRTRDEAPPATASEEAHPGLDTSRLKQDTGWRPVMTLEGGLSATIRWYMANEGWWRPLLHAGAQDDHYGVLRIA